LRYERWRSVLASAANRGAVQTVHADEAWHSFESLLCVRKTRAGKSYKEWLFSRTVNGEPNLDAVQGGAALLLRDVVRERLHDEGRAGHVLSMDAPAGSGADESAPALHELLPSGQDTRSEVELREFDRRAAADAHQFLDALPQREKVALLARELGLSLAHPVVTAVADCGKSMVCAAYRAALERVAEWTRARHAAEDERTQLELTLRLYGHVRELVCAWGETERACARVYRAAGVTVGRGEGR
jgi:hypothetical protein